MNLKGKALCTCLCAALLLSCGSNETAKEAKLEATEKTITFPVSSNTSLFIKSLNLFTDTDGTEYLTFLSNEEPEIYVYDLHTQALVKTIRHHKEGADGIGPKAAGFLMKDWNEIYVPSLHYPTVSVIDSSGHKVRSFDLTAWDKSFSPIPTRSIIGTPFIFHEEKLYGMQLTNMQLGDKKKTESPTDIQIDLTTGAITALPFTYPTALVTDNNKPVLGIESNMGRCFDGKNLVYSFAFDENLHVVTPGKGTAELKPARSNHIHTLAWPEKIPNDLRLAAKMMCEHPFYGTIFYDKYREVYYRIVYPRTEVDAEANFIDLHQFGRSKFAILILDKDFQVIGETLLPDGLYRSNLYFITEEGLFLSESHSGNPAFDEDKLVFRLFQLVK